METSRFSRVDRNCIRAKFTAIRWSHVPSFARSSNESIERKGIDIGPMSVALRHDKIYETDCAACETESGKIDQIKREISFGPDVDEKTKTKLLEISEKCPVHGTLHSEVHITTRSAKG